MKRKILAAALIGTLALSLAACSGSSDSPAEATGSVSESTAASSVSDAGSVDDSSAVSDSGSVSDESGTAAFEGAAAYAVLGLQDMPECNYLDNVSTYHYIRNYDIYVGSNVVNETEAVDLINTYTENENSLDVSVDGHVVSLSKNFGMYSEYQMDEGIVEDALSNLEKAIKNGTNMTGRAFAGTGTDVIPLTDDTAQYDYYEYQISDTVTERYFMKDGDVYAIYTKTTVGESSLEETEVIKSISGDIPEGTIAIPDLSSYEKIE